MKPETAAKLRPAFERVVESGTAKDVQIDGLPIAGKTGTAWKVKDGKYGGEYRASFVGFFPADSPVVAMIVVMDEPQSHHYGGIVAAPVFHRIAQRWIGTFPDVARRAALVEPLPTVAADVPVQIAAAPSPSMVETGSVFQKTSLADEPALAEEDRTSEREEESRASKMPDLTGLSARQAMVWLRTLGADVQVDGRGTVTASSRKPASRSLTRWC